MTRLTFVPHAQAQLRHASPVRGTERRYAWWLGLLTLLVWATASQAMAQSLGVSPSTWSAPAGGGSRAIALTWTGAGAKAWAVETNQNWLTPDAVSGTGDATVTLTATATATGGVCDVGTWLRRYSPYTDLSATASCRTVASYVATLLGAANASGATMNVPVMT